MELFCVFLPRAQNTTEHIAVYWIDRIAYFAALVYTNSYLSPPNQADLYAWSEYIGFLHNPLTEGRNGDPRAVFNSNCRISKCNQGKMAAACWGIISTCPDDCQHSAFLRVAKHNFFVMALFTNHRYHPALCDLVRPT